MLIDKSILDRPEYSFLKEDSKLGRNVALIGLGGSHSYGTNIEGSDIDIRGFATRTPFDIVTNNDFEQVVETNVDAIIYSFDKMLRLLAQCNPNCIEILGLKPEHYLFRSSIGDAVLKNKSLFLSKECIKTFGGYANQQLYRLQQKTLSALTPEQFNGHIAKTINGMSDHLYKTWGLKGFNVREQNGSLVIDLNTQTEVPIYQFYGLINEIGNVVKEYNKTSSRNNHAIEHGKLNKHAMHLIRLYMMCIDLLEKGEIVTYREDEHDLLMDIRNGKYMSEDGLMDYTFFEILHDYEDKFEEAKKVTKLPDKPNMSAIKDFQASVNTCIVRTGGVD